MTINGYHSCRVLLMLMVPYALAAAGQDLSDADTVLHRTRERLLADLARMPRYTCVQTIKRQYFLPPSDGASQAKLMPEREPQAGRLVLRSWDRLRLEVAVVEGNNVYSWVGAPRFEGDTLEQFAGGGSLTSGDFGPFLNAILSSATITFKSEEQASKKRLLNYSYDMPLDRSKYSVKCKEGWVRTAYNGTLVIDPDAADIVRLTVRSAGLTGSNAGCQAISEVEYGRTQIHDRMVLIPRQTRLSTIDPQGSETRSLTTYSSCREYASKVRLLFGDKPSGGASSTLAAQKNRPSTLPAGLHFRARIITSIDSDTAAAGDPIDAVLLSPIRGKGRQEFAPAGTRLHARLLGMAQSVSSRFFQLRLQFESIELNGSAVPLRAAPDLSMSSGIDSGGRGFMAGGNEPPEVSVIPDPATTDNVFIFRKRHLRLERFEWHWTTLPEHESQPSSFAAGLRFRARIVTPIDSDTSVVGDPIEAVLLSPIAGKDGRESAPAGARLYGQLLALKHYTLETRVEPQLGVPRLEPHSYIELLLRFDSIELDGNAVPLRATPDPDVFGGDSHYGEDMLVIPDDATGENLFFFSMQHVHLENFDWDWRTLLEQQSPPQSLPASFPAAARFRARIVTRIDSDTAAAGDPIEAVLLSPIVAKDGREWAHAGARLHGRLLGLQQKELKRPLQSVLEVLIQFESIELNGSEVPFKASPDLSDLSGIYTGSGFYRPEVSVFPHDVLKTNFFIFRKQHLHLENFDWDWTTQGSRAVNRKAP